MKWVSPVFLSPFLNQKAKQGEKEKKFTMCLLRSAKGLLRTLQRTVAPNSCWLQYILKYLPFKKKFGLEYLQLALQLMRAAEPKHNWKSNYQSRSLASFDGSNNMPWGLSGALLKIPAPKWRDVSVHLFASGVVTFWEQSWGSPMRPGTAGSPGSSFTVPEPTHVPSPPSCDGMGSLDKWTLFIMHW